MIFGKTFFEVAGYGDKVEHSSESFWDIITLIIFLIVWLPLEIVDGVLEIEVLEGILDVVEISLVSERQMFDLVSGIEVITLSSKHHDDVAVGVCINMEISRNSVCLEVPLDLAALLLVKLFLNTFFDGTTPVILFIHLFSAKNLACA